MPKVNTDLKKASDIVKETGISRTTLWRLVRRDRIKFEIVFGIKVYSLKEIKKHLNRGGKT